MFLTARIISSRMDYDVAIIGGAFSGAATAILLKRQHPHARIAILERTTHFDRKVGESSTEISSAFMTRILDLSNHLGHHQLVKQGLRFWFYNRADQPCDDCVEVGARYGARLPSFQVDRSVLDQHLLDQAVAAGCDLLRPAKVTGIDLSEAENSVQTLSVETDNTPRTIRARWIVDASGRAVVLGRKLGLYRPNREHPINSVWARFTGTKSWDSHDWREKFPAMANACRTGREWATNHLVGHGWWCWIIPLKGGDVSAGVTYDERIFQLSSGANLGQRLHDHLLSHPLGREIFSNAKTVEGDVRAFSALPYSCDKVAGHGWAAVGDAAGFIDPLYSPGLDFCSYTSNFVANMIGRSLAGEDVRSTVEYYNEQYPVTYRSWFDSLYRDKYYYIGEADLMTASLLLDVSSYYGGLVIPAYRDAEEAFSRLPFEGRPGRIAAKIMNFYRGRLVTLGKNRAAAGRLGETNHGWRALYDGFAPDWRLRKNVVAGLRLWLRAEWKNLFMSAREPARAAAPANVATRAVET